MEIQSAFNSGVKGFQDANRQASETAANIVEATVVATEQPSGSDTSASAETPQQVNLNQELVNLKVAEHQAKASAEVVKTADEVLGTLLDVKA